MTFFRRAAETVEETGRTVSASAVGGMTAVLLAAVAVLAVALVVIARALPTPVS